MPTCRETQRAGGTQAGTFRGQGAPRQGHSEGRAQAGLAVDSDVTSLNMSFLPRHRLIAARISGGCGSHICYL